MVSLSRRTVSGLITTSGCQWNDWSADYRLLSKERYDPEAVFGVVRQELTDSLKEASPLLVAIDDTTSRKKGRKIPGTAWRRDSMSPPFHPNLIWGQRFIQLSGIFPPDKKDAPGRAIPIDLHHAPSAKKPSKKAPPESWAEYRRACKQQSLSRQGVERIQKLRADMDDDGETERSLWMVGDGSYTNGTVLKNIPENTVFTGRIRSDAKLHLPPTEEEVSGKLGRRLKYGKTIIRPEEVRQDPTIEWQKTPVYAAGKVHEFRYKTVGPLLWRKSGADRPLRLVIIAPLGYRLTRHSKLLYRRPAYLICTDPNIIAADLVKAYVNRWDIEVNFRDEKGLLGFNEAQVRTEAGSRLAPALAVSAYAILLLAASKVFGANGIPSALPPPKWRKNMKRSRASTNDLMNHLRFELWATAIGKSNFSHFATPHQANTKSEKYLPNLPSALFYAHPSA